MTKYTFFSYDGGNHDFNLHETAEDAKKYAQALIRDSLDGEWGEDVDQICWGKLIEETVQVDLIERPDDAELDEEGYKDGYYWGRQDDDEFPNSDYDSICNYVLKPVEDVPEILTMTFEERCAHPKKLLCLDFDGVLHRYSRGYQDGSVYDIPTPGAQEFVKTTLDTFDIVVYSARARTDAGKSEMRGWLTTHGFPLLPITCEKPPAFLTIDDRAITFDGKWPAVESLQAFKPWNGVGWKK